MQLGFADVVIAALIVPALIAVFVAGAWLTLKLIEWRMGWAPCEHAPDLLSLEDALRDEAEGEECTWVVRGFKADGDRLIPDVPIEGTVVGYDIDAELGLGAFHVHRARRKE